MSHNFITVCTNHDKLYRDVKVELEQIRSWSVELQIACEALETKLSKLEAIGNAKPQKVTDVG